MLHIRKWENQSFKHSMFFVSLDSVGTTTGGQHRLSQTDIDVTCCILNAWHCKAACSVANAGLICSLNQHASWITMQAAYCMAGVLLSAGECLVVVVKPWQPATHSGK